MSTVDQERRVRDEVEVAADTIAALVIAGVVPISKLQLAAEAAGLMAGEVHTAVRRRDTLGWIPPRHAPTANELHVNQATKESPTPQAEPQPASDPLVPGPGKTPNARAAGSHATARYKRAHAGCADGEKRCPRCGDKKPLEDFAIKDVRSGRRKSMCRGCMKEYQRERYLTIEASERLGIVLRFIVEHGDPIEGDSCSRCHGVLTVGDEVETDDIVLVHHHTCPEGT